MGHYYPARKFNLLNTLVGAGEDIISPAEDILEAGRAFGARRFCRGDSLRVGQARGCRLCGHSRGRNFPELHSSHLRPQTEFSDSGLPSA